MSINCTFDPKYAKKTGSFRILRSISLAQVRIDEKLNRLLRNFNYGILSKNKIIVFDNTKLPIPRVERI